MVSKAIARFTRISPRKARMIADLVRGRQAGEALQLLEFTAKAAAPILKKLIAEIAGINPPVIPGHAEGVSPESITTGADVLRVGAARVAITR